MEKKILKIQLYTLFILTGLNLIYFYYRDGLPDNFYEISYSNQSINFFSYYFFSLLANFGYWCGVWIVGAFVIFSILNSVSLNKKNDYKGPLVFVALVPLIFFVCYLIFPATLGDGLYSLAKENISALFAVSSLLIFGLSFFFLVSEKNFIKVAKFIWKQILDIGDSVRELDFSKFSLEKLKKIGTDTFLIMKERLLSFRKPSEVQAVPSKFKINSQVPAKESQVVSRALVTPLAEKEELDENSEELESDDDDDDEDEDEDLEFNDALDESDDESEDQMDEDESEEYEEIESPFVKKTKNQDPDFDTDELISCIVPKNHSSHTHDPEDQYFETIAKAIEEKLKEFNISAHVINVLKGPVVDTFELELGPGVKVAGVTNRTDDLSLALMGAPIRMVYPMKGKSTIGIEVPRNPRDLIYLDEVLKSKAFKDSSYRLPIAMGKDAYGDAAVIDLASTPHFLVAGTTGAGKSVFVNTLLVSLIIKLSPKKLRLIMIDPKQLELALYQTLPHLVMPVVTDPQIASIALMWAIDEMERRYSLLKDFGVKNIEGFNKKLKVADRELLYKINKYYQDIDVTEFELPYIVIVVDEFADLVLSKSGKAIENSISRLAAKARASGMHIVLATQRPSTDVITGVIKANFPTRVAFRVTTNMDSRVILDTMGAEKLLGKGDMLFKQGIEMLRMHSAFVDEDEIENLVKKLSTIPIQYDSSAIEFIENNGLPEEDSTSAGDLDDTQKIKDERYDEAVRIVAIHRVASASFLQRRLGVGYNRAANLIEDMEKHGVVGPAQGSKPRKVLVAPPADSTP